MANPIEKLVTLAKSGDRRVLLGGAAVVGGGVGLVVFLKNRQAGTSAIGPANDLSNLTGGGGSGGSGSSSLDPGAASTSDPASLLDTSMQSIGLPVLPNAIDTSSGLFGDTTASNLAGTSPVSLPELPGLTANPGYGNLSDYGFPQLPDLSLPSLPSYPNADTYSGAQYGNDIGGLNPALPGASGAVAALTPLTAGAGGRVQQTIQAVIPKANPIQTVPNVQTPINAANLALQAEQGAKNLIAQQQAIQNLASANLVSKQQQQQQAQQQAIQNLASANLVSKQQQQQQAQQQAANAFQAALQRAQQIAFQVQQQANQAIQNALAAQSRQQGQGGFVPIQGYGEAPAAYQQRATALIQDTFGRLSVMQTPAKAPVATGYNFSTGPTYYPPAPAKAPVATGYNFSTGPTYYPPAPAKAPAPVVSHPDFGLPQVKPPVPNAIMEQAAAAVQLANRSV